MTYCTFLTLEDDAGFAKLLDMFIKGKGNKRLKLLKKFVDIKKDLDPEDPTDVVLLENLTTASPYLLLFEGTQYSAFLLDSCN